jgi:uncharacterized protein DUF1844
MTDEKKKIDDDWKRRAREEKSRAEGGAPGAAASRAPEREAEREPAGAPRSDFFPEPNFLVFVSTLASQALLALGEIEHPATGKVEVDLPQAKYTIDLLQMLLEKTKGNRTDDETRALEAYLYDLRMKYVRRSTL